MSFPAQIEESVKAAKTLVGALAQVSNFLITGQPPTEITYKNSYLATIVASLGAYAWNGAGYPHGHVSDDINELNVVIELLGGHLMLPDGSPCLDAAEKEAILRLGHAAHARWLLDQGLSIRIEQLAALAGVADKTVRAATNPKAANPLPVSKDGYWTSIEAEDALAWLARRSDFKPTRRGEDGLQHSLITDETTLAGACRSSRKQAGLSVEQLAAALKWTKSQSSAYRSIESQAPGDVISELRPSVLHQLAQHLKLPDPSTFARQAYGVLAAAHARALSDKQFTGAN